MRDAINLAVLLGNPGEEYAATRHNLGFMVADLAFERLAPGGRWKDWKGKAVYAEAEAAGRRVYLLKPLTYMNLSGEAAQSFAAFYKIPPSATLTAYDDLALPFGKLRLRKDGSAGSHNGMGSVITHLGAGVPRLRLGIGPRPEHIPGKNFVLSRFTKEEGERLPVFLGRACDALQAAFERGLDFAMNRYNNDGDQPLR